jgi:hypothetical protein
LACEDMELGLENDIFDVEQSQMHLPPNIKTNDIKYVKFI